MAIYSPRVILYSARTSSVDHRQLEPAGASQAPDTFSPSDIAHIRLMRAENMTWTSIGKHCGLKPSTICMRWANVVAMSEEWTEKDEEALSRANAKYDKERWGVIAGELGRKKAGSEMKAKEMGWPGLIQDTRARERSLTL
ncbi:hypothetical protein G7K_6443-t1 [Saitoella complicata NRRL Y-17804]|uniref:Myb-like domain-containing protein n=1 Tax=Saitoella complicata (strain BCRC 22490 / CBS 7301 / JCM 7358 / NBRC 10748 / NRRL Y-17804) TaxID=698492 RepID=A0A0E9NSH4_SAICN|nr:hypothetical protein G7K_6443-t1 [Saitoella complicata NRRL Y-17804]